MRKTIALVVVVGMFSFVFISPANAFTTTGNLAVRAEIGASTPDMDFEIHRVPVSETNPFAGGNPELFDLTFPSTSWEVVQRTGRAAQWASSVQNIIVVWASGRGDDYQILADGTGALGTLPTGALGCVPVYSALDEWWIDYNGDGDYNDPGEKVAQGAKPATATVGTEGPILGVTGKSIYSSESPVGSSRIVQIRFMFPPYKLDGSAPFTGYAPIPATTAAGIYTGANVVVRIVAK